MRSIISQILSRIYFIEKDQVSFETWSFSGAPAGARTLDTRLKRAVLYLLSYWGALAGMAGLEPTISESKSGVLPLHYIPICDALSVNLDKEASAASLFVYIWGGIWGSNPRHPEPQSGALPTELIPPYIFKSLRIYKTWHAKRDSNSRPTA